MDQSLEPVKPQETSLFSRSPEDTVKFATAIANALKPIVESQRMYAVIQGKKFPTVECWLTMGAMLGITPREVFVNELPDGSYEAKVELVNAGGRVIGGASALCGIEERRWDKAERYARRSMAVTRATSKAYRIAFSWIIQLAGYQPTPAEEMPRESSDSGFDPDNVKHLEALEDMLEKKQVPKDIWEAVSFRLKGRPSRDLDKVLEEMRS